MSNFYDEANGYDLSSTGTVVELTREAGSRLGWRLEGTAAVDYVVEIKGDDVGWLQIQSYSGATSIDDGKNAPEAHRCRIRNTTTAADGETVDALLGVDN